MQNPLAWSIIRDWSLLRSNLEATLAFAAGLGQYECFWTSLKRAQKDIRWNVLASEVLALRRPDVIMDLLEGEAALRDVLFKQMLGSAALLQLVDPDIYKLQTLEILIQHSLETSGPAATAAGFRYVCLLAVVRGLVPAWEIFARNGFDALQDDDDRSLSPLSLACRTRQWGLVSHMIDHDLSGPSDERLLEDKCWESLLSDKKLDIWHALLDLGLRPASLMRRDGDPGKSWIMFAAESGSELQTIKTVLERFSEQIAWINEDRENVSHYVIKPCPKINLSILELFVRLGVDFGLQNRRGESALYRLLQSPELMRYSKVNFEENALQPLLREMTLRSSCCVASFMFASAFHTTELLRCFLENGAYDVFRTLDANRCSALWHAAKNGNTETLELLLTVLKEAPPHQVVQLVTQRTSLKVSGKNTLAVAANEQILQALMSVLY